MEKRRVFWNVLKDNKQQFGLTSPDAQYTIIYDGDQCCFRLNEGSDAGGVNIAYVKLF